MTNLNVNRRAIFAIGAAAIAAGVTSPALAEPADDADDAATLQDAIDLTAQVDQDLADQDTSIDEQLEILYLAMGEDESIEPPSVMRGPSEDDILRNAVRAVAASFVALGHNLSGELVIHSLKRTGGTYTPNFGSRAKSSPVVKAIKTGRSTSGSRAFTKASGGSYAADLYYAIHLFPFSKQSPTGTTVKIGDTYDFAKEKYAGLQGRVVATMELAQRKGIIKQFRVSITA